MEFDASKVRTEWSNELDGKKGWFNDSINDDIECCLRIYVEDDDEGFYGICTKGDVLYPFKDNDGNVWKYFYPEEDVIEFDKKNLFIAGYNDEDVNIGDEGIIGDTVSMILSLLKHGYDKAVGTLANKDENGFSKDGTWYRPMFYRTKCALKTKYVPWTKETFPLKCGDTVQLKYSDYQAVVSGLKKSENKIWIGNASTFSISFEELFKDYEFPDGTPCGQKVQNK
jgi:hypothetical protein